jgi:hypothetical protein
MDMRRVIFMSVFLSAFLSGDYAFAHGLGEFLWPVIKLAIILIAIALVVYVFIIIRLSARIFKKLSSRQRTTAVVLTLTICCIAALMAYVVLEYHEMLEDERKEGPVNEDYQVELSAGELEIEANATVPIHGKSREFVFDLRKELVSRHLDLGIFPENYSPANAVYGQVTWGDDWVEDVQIYTNNPYLLVMISAAGKVNPVLTFCGVKGVIYRTGSIEARYRGLQASRFFRYIYDYYDENNGIARLNFVNALDAGFHYAHVDGPKSVNVNTGWPGGAGAVTQGVYRLNELYHVGHLKKNNKSPLDRKAWIRFKERDADTRIFIKLWRERPPGPEAKEDMAYVISLEP